MNAQIIAQKKQDRYLKALQIASLVGAVTPNGQPHTYYVESQFGRGRYLAATPDAFPPLGKCSCPDWRNFGSHNEIPCKHIYSAHIWQQATAFVRRHMERWSETPIHVAAIVAGQWQHLTDEKTRLRLKVIDAAATIIEEEQRQDARRQAATNHQPECLKNAGRIDHCDDCLYSHLCANAEPPRPARPDPYLDELAKEGLTS